MSSDPLPQQLILAGLTEKANIKAKVFEQSLDVFNHLKEVLGEISNDYNDLLEQDGVASTATISPFSISNLFEFL